MSLTPEQAMTIALAAIALDAVTKQLKATDGLPTRDDCQRRDQAQADLDAAIAAAILPIIKCPYCNEEAHETAREELVSCNRNN